MIPMPYRITAVIALLLAVFGWGYWNGFRHEHRAWEADTAKRNAAESAAIIARQSDNAKIAQQQADTIAAIQKAHDEELDTVRARLAAAERMRKPAFCGGSTSPAKAESSPSSNAPDTASGLLPEQVEHDIRALILETEEVAATARACQAFVRDNGMAPP